MENQSFTTSLLIDQTPEEVYSAVNNVRGWWSEEIEGGTQNLNDEFFYHYKDVHIARMKLVEVIPNEKVVWLVMENSFNFIEDKSEWVGNQIVFDIKKKGNKIQLEFTQLGLVPQYECFELCKDAWTFYINKSLFSLITTGKGEPIAKQIELNEQLLQQHQK